MLELEALLRSMLRQTITTGSQYSLKRWTQNCCRSQQLPQV